MAAMAPIAVTCGDPSGVGPEIIARWLLQEPEWRQRICPVGPASWLEGMNLEGQACAAAEGPFTPGHPTGEGALVAWEAMRLAAAGCADGRFSAVVTGPVSKHHLQEAGFPFPGQTEFFADAWKGHPSMAFAGRELRVVLATWHEPLEMVPRLLREEPARLERAVLHAVEWAELEGIAEPRIAVCGLNPHAGEGGMLGSEEVEVLNPRLEILRNIYPGLSECLPGDTVFHRMREGEFDVVVSLYHDQGLVAVKTLEFHTAVNLTLGLKHIRTSPDHGTAFAIAGKGIARTDSLAHAARLAHRYAQLRSRVES